MNGSDLDGTFKLYFFDGHPKSVNCYAADYEDDYCGDVVTTTRKPSTTVAPTTTPVPCKTPAEICAEKGDGLQKVCDCYHYTQCWGGGAFNSGKLPCTEGLIWNSVARVCDLKSSVRVCKECD